MQTLEKRDMYTCTNRLTETKRQRKTGSYQQNSTSGMNAHFESRGRKTEDLDISTSSKCTDRQRQRQTEHRQTKRQQERGIVCLLVA